MLVECGFTIAATSDGLEFTFTPSLGRIAALGSPRELVELFAALHGASAERVACEVLAGLCDQEDATPLIGEPQATDTGVRWLGGAMPAAERVIIARHLLKHGMVGDARPRRGKKAGAGRYAEEFDAAEFVAIARAHLGMSAADAEGLSMTELQRLLRVKFPDAYEADEIPSFDDYERTLAALMPAAQQEQAHGH